MIQARLNGRAGSWWVVIVAPLVGVPLIVVLLHLMQSEGTTATESDGIQDEPCAAAGDRPRGELPRIEPLPPWGLAFGREPFVARNQAASVSVRG